MIRFLIDAQLPKKLALLLQDMGYDVIHTLDLPSQNYTKDSEINTVSLNQKRIVVSKDRDFVESLLISDKPYKLLFVNTGNIKNIQLQELFLAHMDEVATLFEKHRLVELTHKHIVVYD